MAGEGAGLRHIARMTACSPAAIRKALADLPGWVLTHWAFPLRPLPRRLALHGHGSNLLLYPFLLDLEHGLQLPQNFQHLREDEKW